MSSIRDYNPSLLIIKANNGTMRNHISNTSFILSISVVPICYIMFIYQETAKPEYFLLNIKSLASVLGTSVHKSWHFPREQFMSDNKIPYISKSIQQNHILPSTQVTFSQWKPTLNSFLCCFGLSRLRWCSVLCRTIHRPYFPSLHNIPFFHGNHPFIFKIPKNRMTTLTVS